MPQFSPRRTQPLRADSYRRLARLVRVYADRLEAAAERTDPRERKAVTDAINGLRAISQHYWNRHHGRNPMTERRREFERALHDDQE